MYDEPCVFPTILVSKVNHTLTLTLIPAQGSGFEPSLSKYNFLSLKTDFGEVDDVYLQKAMAQTRCGEVDDVYFRKSIFF